MFVSIDIGVSDDVFGLALHTQLGQAKLNLITSSMSLRDRAAAAACESKMRPAGDQHTALHRQSCLYL